MQVAGHTKVAAIADEDLDRSTEEKTSAVHFMRFELDDAMCEALKQAAPRSDSAIDHPNYV